MKKRKKIETRGINISSNKLSHSIQKKKKKETALNKEKPIKTQLERDAYFPISRERRK